MNTSNDIKLSETEFIKWIDFDAARSEPFEMDYLIETMQNFWKGLEVYCVAECCGIDAFAFDREQILTSFREAKDSDIENSLVYALHQINKIEEEVLSSSILNQLFHREFFKHLLSHILKVLS